MKPGDVITATMGLLGVNQQQLAGLVNISEGYLSELRANKKIAGRDTALKLSKLSGFPVEHFFEGTKEKGKEVLQHE